MREHRFDCTIAEPPELSTESKWVEKKLKLEGLHEGIDNILVLDKYGDNFRIILRHDGDIDIPKIRSLFEEDMGIRTEEVSTPRDRGDVI